MNIRDLMLSLIRSAIKGEPLSEDVKKDLNTEKLAKLYSVSSSHDISHIIAVALEKDGLLLNDKASQDFILKKEQAKIRCGLIDSELTEIQTLFDKNDIDYIKLKGAQIRSYYPQKWYRTSCDLDILVKEEQLEKAKNLLIKEKQYKLMREKGFHDVSLMSPFGVHLELHYNIKEGISSYDSVLERVWEYSKKDTDSSNMYTQSNEFLMFYCISHTAYHFIGGGCGIRAILDFWILLKSLSLDYDLLTSLLNEAGLLVFYEAVRKLANQWFDCIKADDGTIDEMEKFVILGGTYGSRSQSISHSKAGNENKATYLRKRLFMSYDSLSMLYPIIKKYKILTPFYQIKRWFGMIFKKEKISNELKRISKNSEEINEIREMLCNLELVERKQK